jgi:hypothetical protein
MQDEIDLELKRLTEIFGCEDSGAPEEELPDGEIEAEWLEKIKDWQRADEETEAAQVEADARELRELDELVERLRSEPNDL